MDYIGTNITRVSMLQLTSVSSLDLWMPAMGMRFR